MIRCSHVMKLCMRTTINIDDGLAEDLKEAHLDAVEGAREYRAGMIDAFADLLGIK